MTESEEHGNQCQLAVKQTLFTANKLGLIVADGATPQTNKIIAGGSGRRKDGTTN